MSSPSDQPGASDTALTALSALPPDTPGANSRNFLTSCFFLERETVGNFCELGCNYFITNMSCLSSVSSKEAELAPQLDSFKDGVFKVCSARKVRGVAAVAELQFCGFMLVTL